MEKQKQHHYECEHVDLYSCTYTTCPPVCNINNECVCIIKRNFALLPLGQYYAFMVTIKKYLYLFSSPIIVCALVVPWLSSGNILR